MLTFIISVISDALSRISEEKKKKKKPFSNLETNWLPYVSLNYPSPCRRIQVKSKAILMNNQGKFVTFFFFIMLHAFRVS